MKAETGRAMRRVKRVHPLDLSEEQSKKTEPVVVEAPVVKKSQTVVAEPLVVNKIETTAVESLLVTTHEVTFVPQRETERLEDYDSDSYRLKRLIDFELANRNPNMIGVFGNNSDEVLRKALSEVKTNYQMLGTYYSNELLGSDFYLLIAAAISQYSEKMFNRCGTPVWQKKILEPKISMLSNNPRANDTYGYFRMDESDSRNVVCDNLFGTMKRMFNLPDNTKFVLHINFYYCDNFNRKILEEMKHVNNPNLLIIASSNSSIETNTAVINRDYRELGIRDNLLERYFCFSNIVICRGDG